MNKHGKSLSEQCIKALVDAGEVSEAEVERREKAVSSLQKVVLSTALSSPACPWLRALTRRDAIMKVSDIIQIKGSVVKTVRPETSARELSVRLHADQIGAMVVSSDGGSIDGIVTERDLAYGLAAHGSNLPTIAVSRLMTNVVVVCSPEDSIAHVMKLMTQRRVRHLPVKEGDQLVGIVSIGDVLKHRLDELELEANVMRDYAVAARR